MWGKDPHPDGQEPQVFASGIRRCPPPGWGWRWGGGGEVLTVETGDGFLPCWTGRGRGGAERKKRPGVKPGEGPTGPGKWVSACPKSGVLWGIRSREGLAPFRRALVPPRTRVGDGEATACGPPNLHVARRPLTCQ